MAAKVRGQERRQEPLSREGIVAAAVELLDAVGERGLTFRALAERLATGPGAIYWHVTGKGELLAAATEEVVAAAMPASSGSGAAEAAEGDGRGRGDGSLTGDEDGRGAVDGGGALGGGGGAAEATPQEAVRALALGLFDAIDAHPWVGAQLSQSQAQSPVLRIFEGIGRQVQALGVPEAAWFTAASALMSYVLGVAGQNAANARSQPPGANRAASLDAAATTWSQLDPDDYPFVRSVANRLREHDDREEFLAGVNLILAGITSLK